MWHKTDTSAKLFSSSRNFENRLNQLSEILNATTPDIISNSKLFLDIHIACASHLYVLSVEKNTTNSQIWIYFSTV